MRFYKVIVSLLVGFGFALLSWWVFGGHFVPHRFGGFWDYLGDLIVIVCLPGLFAGMIASGNVHGGSTAVTVLVNFLFYFVATRFIFAIRQKRSAKSRQAIASSDNQNTKSMR